MSSEICLLLDQDVKVTGIRAGSEQITLDPPIALEKLRFASQDDPPAPASRSLGQCIYCCGRWWCFG